MLKRTVNHHESVMIGVCDRLADLTNIEVTLNEVLDMKTRIDQTEGLYFLEIYYFTKCTPYINYRVL